MISIVWIDWLIATYVAGVDEPGDISVGGELSIDVAADLTVLPAVVDMNDGHHVPLKDKQQRNHHGQHVPLKQQLNHSARMRWYFYGPNTLNTSPVSHISVVVVIMF